MEHLCERVALIDHGNILYTGTLESVLDDQHNGYHIFPDQVPEACLKELAHHDLRLQPKEHYWQFPYPREKLLILHNILAMHGVNVYEVEKDKKSLEEWFFESLQRVNRYAELPLRERMKIMRNVRLVAHLSINEMIRRKILPIVGIMTVGFFVLFDFEIGQQVTYQALGNSLTNLTRIFSDKVLAAFFINQFIGFMAIFIVPGSVTPEVDNGTLLIILARPLKRWEIIAGKWTRVALMQLVVIPLLVLITTLIIRFHFPHQPIPFSSLIQTILAFLSEGWILNLLALFGSIFFSQVANGILVGLAFVINFILGSICQLTHDSLILATVSSSLNLLMPTDYIAGPCLNGAAGSPIRCCSRSWDLSAYFTRQLVPF
jgi:ABC-type transport system involved in multi-copper enzyme maturation permease subunit